MKLEGKALKVSTLLEPAAVAALVVPNGKPRIVLQVSVSGRTLTADLNAKSLRRCIAAIEAAEPGCIAVLLQGTLDGNTIQEAGIVAQPKTPKMPKPAEAAA
jgi:hypothetical protein